MKELTVVREADKISVSEISLSKHLVVFDLGSEILTYNEENRMYVFIDPADGRMGGECKTIEEVFEIHGDDLKVYEL